MSNEISQNKGPKKMGHMGIHHKESNVNNYIKMPTADAGSGSLDLNNSPTGNSTFHQVGAPLMENNMNNENVPMHMESNINNQEPLIKKMENNVIKHESPMMIENKNMTDSKMTAYDSMFSEYDNIGNNREISNAINPDMIANFESRFVKKPVNKIETDIDITGESSQKKIIGASINNNDTSYYMN